MKEFLNNLCSTISSGSPEIIVTETLQEYIAQYNVDRLNEALPANVDISKVNTRDALEITIFETDEDTASPEIKYVSSTLNSWHDFSEAYNSLAKDEPRTIKIKIVKNTSSNRISIYDPVEFLRFLKGLSFEHILNIFDKQASIGCRIFEIQGEFDRIVAGNFAFVPKDFTPSFSNQNRNISGIILKGNQLCCTDLIKEHLVPSDFSANHSNGNQGYLNFLNKVLLLYAACFLFDYIKYTNGLFDYKINGFKTISETLDVKRIGDSMIEFNSSAQIYEVYEWVYTGGNPLDKIVIARNILSLNLLDSKTLAISAKTIDAIISNYRIYEKENVKQYISVRNDISKQLRDYQKEIIKIVDEFDGDFKKSFFTSLTFVFTTVLIRVLAKNITDTVLVPDIILFLLIGYCILSLCYYFYARWVLDSKIKLFDAQYKKSRKYYEEILSEKELSDLFDDIQTGDGSHAVFQEERKTKYRNLWLWGTASLMAIFIIILISNHWDVLTEIKDKLDDLYRIYKDCKQCCPHCGK